MKTPAEQVAVIMGSKSDWETMKHAVEMLGHFGIPHEARVVSAHRTPDLMANYAQQAAGRGLQVIIAGVGGAAHLPGMVAAHTHLPVLGVPVQSRAFSGWDSLRPAAMANPLGDLWEHGEPDWAAALAYPAVKLHLYGKAQPKPGRKMGHLVALGSSVNEAADLVCAARGRPKDIPPRRESHPPVPSVWLRRYGGLPGATENVIRAYESTHQ